MNGFPDWLSLSDVRSSVDFTSPRVLPGSDGEFNVKREIDFDFVWYWPRTTVARREESRTRLSFVGEPASSSVYRTGLARWPG